MRKTRPTTDEQALFANGQSADSATDATTTALAPVSLAVTDGDEDGEKKSAWQYVNAFGGWLGNSALPFVFKWVGKGLRLFYGTVATFATADHHIFVTMKDDEDDLVGGSIVLFGKVVNSGVLRNGQKVTIVDWSIGGVHVDIPAHFIGDDLPPFVTDKELIAELLVRARYDQPMVRRDDEWMSVHELEAAGVIPAGALDERIDLPELAAV